MCLMGPDKFLHGQILSPDRLFTWIGANSVAVVFTRIHANFRAALKHGNRNPETETRIWNRKPESRIGNRNPESTNQRKQVLA